MIEKLLSDKSIRNGFNVNKIFTTATASTGTGTQTETRQILDEREITLQMNIGLVRNGSSGKFEFIKNVFEPKGAEKIYNNCPDNIMEFLSAYKDKYGKFPNGNVTANYYEKNGDGLKLLMSSQGASEVSFGLSQTSSQVLSKDFFDKYSKMKAGETFEVLFKPKFSPSPYYPSLSAATIVFDDQNTEGRAYFVNDAEVEVGSTADIDKQWFLIAPNSIYHMGYLTNDEIKSGSPPLLSEIKERQFLAVQMVTDEENHIVGMTTTVSNKKLHHVDAFSIAGYPEGTTQYINNLQIMSRHSGGLTTTVSEDGNVNEVENKLLYQFIINLDPGTQTDLYKTQFLKYEERNILTPQTSIWQPVSSQRENVEGQTIPDRTGEVPILFTNAYMYLDPALHLPDVYMEP